MEMTSKAWRWSLGIVYIFAVALIWVAASFVVQSVVDSGVSPFLITYICNSLFLVYIPIVEIARYVENTFGSLCFWRTNNNDDIHLGRLGESEEVVLLGETDLLTKVEASLSPGSVEHGATGERADFVFYEPETTMPSEVDSVALTGTINISNDASGELDSKGRWTRTRTAKASLVVCPFWFLAQLTFNLSLKYTTVTSNTILSTTSTLFTFLVSIILLGERFAWFKLFSVILCMGGTVIVSLGDSAKGSTSTATNPVLGDILSLVSSCFYAAYITLIRQKLPNEDDSPGKASMALFLGYLGLFNLLIFLPVALVLNFTKLEPFHALNWKQFGLIIGKGLLDNVLSDYMWVKAVLYTSTTVATAGLTIQVPVAAIVDTIRGHAPHFMNFLGAAAVMVGFAGINVPSGACSSKDIGAVEATVDVIMEKGQELPISSDVDHIS